MSRTASPASTSVGVLSQTPRSKRCSSPSAGLTVPTFARSAGWEVSAATSKRQSTYRVLIEHAPAQRVHGPPAGQAQQRLRSEAPFATWVVTEAQAEEVEDVHSAVREAAGQQRALGSRAGVIKGRVPGSTRVTRACESNCRPDTCASDDVPSVPLNVPVALAPAARASPVSDWRPARRWLRGVPAEG